MSQNPKITGTCNCGSVHYESMAEPLVMLNCHCRDCQQTTGGSHAAWVVLPADGFRFTEGSPQFHFTESLAMGEQKRSFCGNCGSRLTGGQNRAGTSPFVALHAASLSDPGCFQPQMNVWTCDAQPWAHLDPTLPQFDQYPPM